MNPSMPQTDVQVTLSINIEMEFARDQLVGKIADGTYVMEDVPCFCGSFARETVSEFDRYDIESHVHLCLNCGIAYVSPRLTEAASRQFYANEYRHLYQTKVDDDHEVAMTQEEDFEHSYRNGIGLRDVCLHYDIDPEIVVDIGCNAGGMLKVFADSGKTVYGVDWDEEAVQYGRDHGMPIEVGDAADLLARGIKADLVILHHVLEHCHDLRKTLDEVRQLLALNGVVWIALPGIKTTSLRNMFQSAHLWHFTFDTLEYMMNCCGYRQLYCSEGIQSLWKYSGEYRKLENVHPTALHDILDRFGRDPLCLHEVKVVCKFPLAVIRTNIEAVLESGLPDASILRDSQLGKEGIIIAGGPSVESQLPALRRLIANGCLVLSIEKMNAWCLKHGIVPDYVVATDACEDVADSLSAVSSGTTVVLATLCGQRAVDALKGKNVVIFNAATDMLDLREMAQRHGYFPATVYNAGGSVALASMSAAMAMGMTHLHIFGFDCHVTAGLYANGITGVGTVSNQEWIDVKNKDGTVVGSYLTTPPYFAFAQQFFKLMDIGKRLGFMRSVKVYGDSLVTAMSVEDIHGE